jgi:sugar lactone lactonase YvrE
VTGLAFAPDGDLLVSDALSQVVHRLDLEGETYRREVGVGAGQDSDCGVDEPCPGPRAGLGDPAAIACDSFSRLFVADKKFGVLRLDSDLEVRSVTSSGDARVFRGNDWDYGRPSVEFSVGLGDIAVDTSGNLVFFDNLRAGLLFVRAPAGSRGTP